MRKNIAGQSIGGQMTSKTDGSPVTTGNTTVYVTGDGGIQALGTVGSGLCTHEGNGFWTYAPSASETNYTKVDFTFVNAAAITATVQVYTTTTLGPTTASSATTSTTTQLTTFRDLYMDLQNRVRTQTGVSATENQAKRYINIANQDFYLGFDYKYPWAEKRAILRTHAPYSTGTATIAVGATTLTGTDTFWATANAYSENNMRAGGKVTLAGGANIYPVTTVSADTVAALQVKYVGTADLTAESYKYFEDEYDLATDFLRPVSVEFFTDDTSIPLIGRAEWRRRYPRPNLAGHPKVACIIDEAFNGSTTPVRRLAFYPYPDATYLIPYSYISSAVAVSNLGVKQSNMVEDDDEPIMPLRYRHALVFHALSHWYRDKKDDARSQEAKAEYTDIMSRITNDQEIGTHVQASIQPRMNYYTRQAYTPYRKRGSRIMDLNNEFDQFRR
jgi:hypothetical protein